MVSRKSSPLTLLKIKKCEEHIPVIARSLSRSSDLSFSSPKNKKNKTFSRESLKEDKLNQDKISYLEYILQDTPNLFHTSRSSIIDEIAKLKKTQNKKYIHSYRNLPKHQYKHEREPGIITNIFYQRGYGFISSELIPDKDLIFYTKQLDTILVVGDLVEFTRVKTNKKSDIAQKVEKK